MMEDNKNNNSNDKYRDFFESEDDQSRKGTEHQEYREQQENQEHLEHQEEEASTTTSYYRYGPFYSSLKDEEMKRQDSIHTEDVIEDASETSLTAADPESTRSLVNRQVDSASQNRMAPVTKSMKKRSPWVSMFASFMSGVIVVGSLMFASDRMDLFTADQSVFSDRGGISHNEGVTPSLPGNDSLQNAALDLLRPNNIAEIVAESRGSVVKIETYSKVVQGRRSGSILEDEFFRYFFGDQNDRNGQEDAPQGDGTLRQSGVGSGFIFDNSGYILTNQHVIEGASEIRVYVEGYDEPFVATKLGESFDLDLAALKIKGSKPFPALKIGNADQLNVGDWVVAIGNPYGFDHTVTVGVLSAKERPITIPGENGTRQYQHLLQTDASINPGNSGGPLLNLNGEVVGINTAVNAQAQGIGFAIPTGTITEVLDNLKNNEPIPKDPAPYIGVALGDLNKAIAEQLGFSGTKGSVVTQVEVGSPAYQSGIKAGDIITEVSGTVIKNSEDVVKKIKGVTVGAKTTIKVFRDGKMYEVVVIIGDRNAGSN
jgi:serine protease Do